MKLSDLNIVSHKKKGNTLILTTDQSLCIIATFLSDRTAKLYVDFMGNAEPNESYAVENSTVGVLSDPTVCEMNDDITFGSGELSLRFTKRNIRIDYIKNNSLLSSEKEIVYNGDGSIRCVHYMKETEHFYGLGEDNDAYLGNMDRRNTVRDMVTGQRINIGHVTADIPVTFFMSTGGNSPYGIFVDNSYRMIFDMGKTNSDEYFWQAEGGSFIQYFFCGNSFDDILGEYTDLTGKPSIPPLWVLGYIQSRCSYWSWEEIDEIVEVLEEKRFPLDCIVFDYDWAEHFQNFKWNKRWNGESPKKIAEYHGKGIRFMVSNSGPMIRKDSDNFQSALDAGILASDKNGNTVTCGHYGGELMDFSNPKMKAWIQPQLNKVLDDGIDGWWLDLTEPEGDPDGTQYYGGDKAKIHNPFCLMNVRLYNEITLEYNKNKRPFILTRTGTAGIQKYNAAIWSGDVFSDYKTLSAHIPEALNTAMSGITQWTCDSGGFMSATNNSIYTENIYKNDPAAHTALYERWLQFACFCPITRVHHAGQSSPFVFGELLTDGAAHYMRLRYRLLPYIYSYNYKAHITGSPMMRALVFEYSDDENVLDIKDEYLFGSELLVAPITEEKATQRRVYFPKGKWYDWDYGYCYEGGKSSIVYAPQNRIPVFVKGGSIIPMIEQTYHTSDIDWKHIDLKIYPNGKCSFDMFTDDGISYDYLKGGFTVTHIECEENDTETHIRIMRSNLLFAADEYRFEIHVNAEPKNVVFGEKELSRCGYKRSMEKSEEGWFFDKLNNVLYIKLTADKETLDELVIMCGAKIGKFSENSDSDQICGQLPFLLPPAAVPCSINCENYDRGGEGVAYHKLTEEKNEIYRTDSVLIELCDDIGVGYNVKNMIGGEWLEYTVNVVRPGEYIFGLRIQGSGKISVDINSQNRSGLIEISADKWETYNSVPIMLAEGEQVLRLFVHEGKIKANRIEISNA
ncbi:MAG: DUF5110 domain-containing protein [[Eubacterium] siraeum]|nr:DUF5110 domain-containing protein [[Eubacterium] siraeum]